MHNQRITAVQGSPYKSQHGANDKTNHSSDWSLKYGRLLKREITEIAAELTAAELKIEVPKIDLLPKDDPEMRNYFGRHD
jgi:hypothetical protein